jgi:hypothetical protein
VFANPAVQILLLQLPHGRAVGVVCAQEPRAPLESSIYGNGFYTLEEGEIHLSNFHQRLKHLLFLFSSLK